jgi:hypothetical protein
MRTLSVVLLALFGFDVSAFATGSQSVFDSAVPLAKTGRDVSGLVCKSADGVRKIAAMNAVSESEVSTAIRRVNKNVHDKKACGVRDIRRIGVLEKVDEPRKNILGVLQIIRVTEVGEYVYRRPGDYVLGDLFVPADVPVERYMYLVVSPAEHKKK